MASSHNNLALIVRVETHSHLPRPSPPTSRWGRRRRGRAVGGSFLSFGAGAGAAAGRPRRVAHWQPASVCLAVSRSLSLSSLPAVREHRGRGVLASGVCCARAAAPPTLMAAGPSRRTARLVPCRPASRNEDSLSPSPRPTSSSRGGANASCRRCRSTASSGGSPRVWRR